MHPGGAARLLFHPIVGKICPPPLPAKFILHPPGVYDNGRVLDVEICEYHKTVDLIHEQLLCGEIGTQKYRRMVIDSFCKTINLDELKTFMRSCIDPIGANPDQFNLEKSF